MAGGLARAHFGRPRLLIDIPGPYGSWLYADAAPSSAGAPLYRCLGALLRSDPGATQHLDQRAVSIDGTYNWCSSTFFELFFHIRPCIFRQSAPHTAQMYAPPQVRRVLSRHPSPCSAVCTATTTESAQCAQYRMQVSPAISANFHLF